MRSTLLYTWETLEIPREVDVKSTVIYEDVVRRTPEGWRFASRTIVMAGEPVPEDVAASPAH